jgi:hypothetical protein
MYVIIRDPITRDDVEVDSLTGFVKGEPVEKESLGTPLSETPSGAARPSLTVRHFVLPAE